MVFELCDLFSEVARVTFSDSDSVLVPKFFNPVPAILQIWESDSCSDSGYNNRCKPFTQFTHVLRKKLPYTLLLLPKLKSTTGSRFGFSQIFDPDSGSERKRQNPAGVDCGTPEPVLPLLVLYVWARVALFNHACCTVNWAIGLSFLLVWLLSCD